MAIRREAVTLNGVDDFSAFGRDFGWDQGFRESVRLDAREGNSDGYRLEATFRGNWETDFMRMGADFRYFVDIVDSGDRGERRIKLLEIGQDGPATVSLTSTRVDFIQGGEFNVELTTGSERIRAIELFEGNHTITVREDGEVASIRTNQGDDRVTVENNGNVDSINVSGGTNTIVLNGGRANALIAYEGDDTVRITDGGWIDIAVLGSGNHDVTVSGADSRIESLLAFDGNDTILIEDGARINIITLGEGDSDVTTADRFIDRISAYDGNATIKIGPGGAGNLKLGVGTHSVVTQGFLESYDTYGDSATVIKLNGGAGSLRMADGNDKVTTGNDFVENISVRDGKNVVTVGDGGAGQVRGGNQNDKFTLNGGYVQAVSMREGNDKLILDNQGVGTAFMSGGNDKVTVKSSEFGGDVSGGEGTDTLILKPLKAAVTFDFGSNAHQDITGGAEDPDLPDNGFFAFFNFEKVVGTDEGDSLTGRDADEAFVGGKGNDTLDGAAGNDTLTAGPGRDVLTGGDGADEFRFGKKDGAANTITDFEIGDDQIAFAGAKRLSDIGFSPAGDDVEVSFGGVAVTVEGVTVEDMRDADNFAF